MGVKDLWTVLEPVGERCTMADLQGKRLAVDISGWIFQSLQSPVFVKKPTMRPHLRNLFWRLHHLMRNNVRVIVVFDGPSPKLKGVALAQRAVARRQQREKGQVVEEESVDDLAVSCGTAATGFRTANVVENTYFAQLCAECKEMLRVFRIPYIVSSGDAEATCAYLNRLGSVDGCITDDNDAFLFGASIVYRHYTCDKKRVENLRCYDAKIIEEQLGLAQDHLIAMALILGCDYGLVGIKGIGKERALEVLQSWPGCDPLEKLSQWRTDIDMATLMKFDPAAKPEHCRYCGHLGNMFVHKDVGCNGCAREGRVCTRTNSEEWTCHCEWHRKHAEFKSKQVEIKIMKAAIEDSNFPDKDIIATYKQPCPDDHPGTFCWTRPQYSEMHKFVSRLFGWPKDKTREKIITYLTAFDLCAVTCGDLPYHHCCQPEKVIAKRVENGREMYEVEWRTIPDVPLAEDDAAPREVITKELKDVFTAVFPDMVTEFEETKKLAKQKQGKSKSKRSKAENEDASMEGAGSPVPKKARKKAKEKLQRSEEALSAYEKDNACMDEAISPIPKSPRKKANKKSQKNDDENQNYADENEELSAAAEGENAENQNDDDCMEEASSPVPEKAIKKAIVSLWRCDECPKKKPQKSDEELSSAAEDENAENQSEDACVENDSSSVLEKENDNKENTENYVTPDVVHIVDDSDTSSDFDI